MESTRLELYDDGKRLFDGNTTPEAKRWLLVSLGFAACGGIGLWTGYANLLLNAFILGYGGINIALVMQWLRRLKQHIARSEQIIWEYSRMTINEILQREEYDRPLAAVAIKAKCMKAIRGLGEGHESILRCLRQALQSELAPMSQSAKVLPAMGLVGTCGGMMGTLHAIGKGAADVADVEAISQAVSGALPAMAVAVSTTLAAAFIGSLVVSGLVHIAKTKAQHFLEELNAQLDMFCPRPSGIEGGDDV